MSIVRRSGALLACLVVVCAALATDASAQAVFGNPISFTGGEDVQRRVLAAGDVDGDGNSDITWLLGNSLSLTFGNGLGAFGPPVSIPSGLPTLGPELVSGDLNSDGRLDVVVGPGPGQTIGLLGIGNPVSGLATQTLPLLRPTGTWPFLADADDDGDDDVYMVGNGLTLLENDGNANLTLVYDFDGQVSQERNSIGVGDLDNDGRADLVLPAIDGDHPGLDIAYIGADLVTGLPRITSISVQPSQLEPGFLLQLGDLDGDGDLDIVLHGRSTVTAGAVIQVLRNNGARSFSALPPVSSLDRTGNLTVDMLLSDLDGDGLLDVVLGCAEDSCRTLVGHSGTGGGGLGPAWQIPVLAPSRRLLAMDVDCDGDDDIVGGADTRGVTVVLNLGGNVYEDQSYGSIAGTDIVAASVNGDISPDLVGIDSTGVEVAFGEGCGVGPIEACVLPTPLANAGDDVVACGQPGVAQTITLDGLRSGGGRPIARYCWETTLGVFAENGSNFYCSQQITADLEMPTIAGRSEAIVTLTVTDFQGCSDSDTVSVATESEPVVLEARASVPTACQGDDVSFIARAADIFSPILTYGWDFDITRDTNGDGIPGNDVEASVQAVSGGLGVVSHSYLSRGSYTARLLVMGNGTCTAMADVPIEIVSAPRITAMSGPSLTCPGRSGSFSVSQTGGTQPLLYSWDFDTSVDADGNGNPADDSQAVVRNPSFAYATPGEKTVRVTVRGAGGCSDTREITVVVAQPADADFIVASPVCGTPVVSFEDNSTGLEPLTATWDFGDGSPLIAGLSATHAFPGPGTYVVTQTVRDGNGCTTQVSKTVTIADVALELVSTQLFDGQDGSDSEGNANGFGEPGETVQLAFTARNTGSNTATGVVGNVRVVSPLTGVTVLDDQADFPAINGGESVRSLDPHVRLHLDDSLTCGMRVLLEVELLGFGSESCADTQLVSLTIGLPALALFASEAPVTDTMGRSISPSAAHAEDTHVTVFSDDTTGTSQVFFVRHLFDGPRVLPPVLLSESGMNATRPRVAWNPTHRELGVTWRRVRPDGGTVIVFARVDKTGNILGEIVELATGEADRPDVVWTGSEWLVAWISGEERVGFVRTVRARMLDSLSRTISPVLDVSGDGLDHSHVRLQATGGTFQISYTSFANAIASTDLRVRTYFNGATDALVPISDRLITGVAREAPGTGVLAGRYLLAWTTAAGNIQVQQLNSGGSALTTENAGTGRRPAVAAGPNFAVLTYEVNGEIFARGIAQTGALFSRVVTVSGGIGESLYPTISASPQGLFMILWQDLRGQEGALEEIFGAVILPIGDPNCTIAGLGDLSPQPGGDGVINVADVILLLRVAVGLEPVTAEILQRGDVAPGIREGDLHRVVGDGLINVGDVVVLIDVAVGNIRLTPASSP